MKFVAIFKLNEEFRSSSLALKKEQRKMTSSLKSSSAVTRCREIEYRCGIESRTKATEKANNEHVQ